MPWREGAKLIKHSVKSTPASCIQKPRLLRHKKLLKSFKKKNTFRCLFDISDRFHFKWLGRRRVPLKAWQKIAWISVFTVKSSMSILPHCYGFQIFLRHHIHGTRSKNQHREPDFWQNSCAFLVIPSFPSSSSFSSFSDVLMKSHKIFIHNLTAFGARFLLKYSDVEWIDYREISIGLLGIPKGPSFHLPDFTDSTVNYED